MLIGLPYGIMLQHKEKYQCKQGKKVVAELTEHSYGKIAKLLREGCY
jgi:hypothetical protein